MGDTGVFYTEEIGSGLRVAQVLGLTSTAFFCGKTFAQSFSTTPAFLLAPAPLLAKQWKKMFDNDKSIAPLIVLFSGGVFSLLAWREPKFSTPSLLYHTSAVLVLTCLPYSLYLVHPISEKLKAKAASLSHSSSAKANQEVSVKKEETVHYLVDQWATMNLGRTVLTGVAAVLATWAAVEKLMIREFRVGSGVERMGR